MNKKTFKNKLMKLKYSIWDILLGVVIGLWIGAIIVSFYVENTWLNLLNEYIKN